ncbi:flagellar export chaperone FliS [Roseibium sp.]|uniref:flagellar export chaperone FliS n=1 Tax=Roseibium sp. TaxID=1936156 RepID=UPI003A96D031
MSYALNHAISAYRQATTTVPPTAAVTLLLDEVLNAIALAAKHTRNKEFEEAFLRTNRAIGILKGLRQNLDLDAGGQVAEQMMTMYSSNIRALTAVTGKTDAIVRFTKIATGLLVYRNAWAEMTTLSERAEKPLLDDINGSTDLSNAG